MDSAGGVSKCVRCVWLFMSSLTPALAETLAVFEDVREPLSTNEVCDALDVGRRSTYDRLDRLQDAGSLRSKSVGASGRVWWNEPTWSANGSTADDRGQWSGSDDETIDASAGADGGTDAGTASDRNDSGDRALPATLDAAPVGVAIFDANGRLVDASETFAGHLGTTGVLTHERVAAVPLIDENGGRPEDPIDAVWTDVHADDASPFRRVRAGANDGSWLAVSTDGTDDGGVVATTRDVTALVDCKFEVSNAQATAELELDGFRPRTTDGFATIDSDGYVVDVDERFAGLAADGNVPPDTLVDQHVDTAFDAVPEVKELVTTCVASGESVSSDDPIASGDRSLAVEAIPVAHGASVYVHDVTDQVERERDRKRYTSLVDALGEPVYEMDPDGHFRFVNDAAVESTGYSRETLVGSHVSIGMEDEAVEAVRRQLRAVQEEDSDDRLHTEFEIEPKDGESYPIENWVALLRDDDGRVTGSAGIFRDISERRERERRLERYEEIVETVEDGVYVLDDANRFALVNEAFAAMVDESKPALVGAPARDILDDLFVDQAERVVAADGDGRGRGRFQETVQPTDGESFIADVRVSTFDFDGEPSGRVAVLRDVTERVERERRIANQRERVETLNEVNALVRDVASAAVEGSTREHVETLVCEALADASAYSFAWIGDVDPHDGTVVLRTEAGVENYLSDVTITTDPNDERSNCAVGRAIREGSVQTVQDATTDSRYDPWREHVERHRFLSAAAIPITYEGTLYGVLSVHSDRRMAFTEKERAVIERIGELVGHAFAAVDRKRALTSEEVVMLDYRVGGLYDTSSVDVDATGRITLEEAVRVDDDELLVYGSMSGDGVDELRALVTELDAWTAVSVIDSTGDGGETRFELRTSEAPAFSHATAAGGYIERATIEDGSARILLHVPPEADVRSTTEAMQSAYSDVELVAQRQVSRPATSMSNLQREVDDALTERQQASLEAAFHAGFFEWPRETIGGEVAASLGVSPPTFSQHIRLAERKVFDLLLGDGSVTTDRTIRDQD
jgi:PAS domain S-box-containing protein